MTFKSGFVCMYIYDILIIISPWLLKISNIYCFQLLKCDDLLLFSILYYCKLNLSESELLLSVFPFRRILHSHFPFHYAVGFAHTWSYSARGNGWNHLLPLPWYLSPFRSTGIQSEQNFYIVSSTQDVHIQKWILFDLFRCGWMLALRSFSLMWSALGS